MGTPKNDENATKQQDQSSANPPGWPNMPARSADHERHAGKGSDADVTEQQRELEKTTRK